MSYWTVEAFSTVSGVPTRLPLALLAVLSNPPECDFVVFLHDLIWIILHVKCRLMLTYGDSTVNVKQHVTQDGINGFYFFSCYAIFERRNNL